MKYLNHLIRRLLKRLRPRKPITQVLSQLTDGFIVPPTHLALIVSDHCNVSCRSCNHGSPVLPRYSIQPESVQRDCAVLAKVYRPKLIKVLGGETLLHRQLGEVIQAARSTGICSYFHLVTNGMLLERMDDTLWDSIEGLEISCYPGMLKTEQKLQWASDKAKEHGVKLTVSRFDNFRHTMTTVGTQDKELVADIYRTCKMANVWGCHSFRDGFFYKCPQSLLLRYLVDGLADSDRIAIQDHPGFQSELLSFVNSPKPLSACHYCVGTVGKQHPHEMLDRRLWPADLQQPSEDLVDREWMERCKQDQLLLDDCKSVQNRQPQGRWISRLIQKAVPIIEGTRPK